MGQLGWVKASIALVALVTLTSYQNCSGFKMATKQSASSSLGFRPAFGSSSGTKFGMFYLALNCLANPANFDISKYIHGEAGLGPVPEFHWWTEPAEGYYCIVRDRQVLRNHAIQLRDMGIDFIYFDNTNFSDANNEQAKVSTLGALKALMEEWSRIPGAPKVAVWQPLSPGATIPDAVDQILQQYPDMLFRYQGKPLMLVVETGQFPVDPGLWNRFADRYTLRKMWGVYGAGGGGSNWSFMEHCQAGFKESNGTGPCNQRVTVGPDGRPEQISVTTAYQSNWISNFAQSVPQFEGRTFLAQMKALDQHPDVPIVTITGWNEWVAMRFCRRGGAPVADCGPGTEATIGGNPIFTDQYDKDYNRDIEPSKRYGDRMYQVVKAEVLSRKTKVIGWVDQAVATNGGTVTINGWACIAGGNRQIDVHVYLGGAAGNGGTIAAGAAANLPSEPGIAEACGDALAHRFSAIVDAATAAGSIGKPIFVHGIGGVQNPTIGNSGSVDMPAPVSGGQAPAPATPDPVVQTQSQPQSPEQPRTPQPSQPQPAQPQPPQPGEPLEPAGFFKADAGPGVYYSNGQNAFCLIANWDAFLMMGGASNGSNIRTGRTSLPTNMANHGVCYEPPQPAGFFKSGPHSGIYYSNGVNAFCGIPTWDKFLAMGGDPWQGNVVQRHNSLPSGMANHGACQ